LYRCTVVLSLGILHCHKKVVTSGRKLSVSFTFLHCHTQVMCSPVLRATQLMVCGSLLPQANQCCHKESSCHT
jgi:hypothetical protein